MAFVDNDVPVSIDQDHTNLYNKHLSAVADFKTFVFEDLLNDSIVRPVMFSIAPENLWVLWKKGIASFKLDEEFFREYHLGIAYVRDEGLNKEYIAQTIKAIKSIADVRALAREAGYSGQDLEEAVQYVESNQKHLGADVDFVWKVLTGKSGGFQKLDQAMKAQNGGIDLTPANMDLQTQNAGAGEGIKFHLDPAMMQRLQNTSGFVPVIINIQPMADLRRFLGVDLPEITHT